jgi:hypothetical protein
MLRPRYLIEVLMASQLIACASEGARTNSPIRHARTDSAGVEVVQATVDGDIPALHWTVHPSPTVVMGNDPGASTNILQALRLGDGKYLVVPTAMAKAPTPIPRIYDSTGKFVGLLGRSGRGPGEFAGLIKASHGPGDSILALDSWQNRASVFDREAKFGRSFPVKMSGTYGWGGIGGFIDGSVLYMSIDHAANGKAIVSVYRYPPSGGSAQRIAQALAWNPIGDIASLWALQATLAVGKSRVYYNDPRDYDIHVFAPEGKETRLIRLPVKARAVSAAEVSSVRDSGIAGWRASNPGKPDDEARKNWQSLTVPPILQSIDMLVEDAEGGLWAREFNLTHAKPDRWFVIDSTGALLGTVSVPTGWRVEQIGPDYVLVIVQGEEGEDRVEVHRLSKPRS